MPSALQRLLSRPASLDVLRFLVASPALLVSYSPASTNRGCFYNKSRVVRHQSSAAARVREESREYFEAARDDEELIAQSSIQSQPQNGETQGPVRKGKDISGLHNLPNIPGNPFGPYTENLWTEEDLEFESNLADNFTTRKRLLDQAGFSTDLRLFACLLNYRERKYGLEGVAIFWESVKRRGFLLPTASSRPNGKGAHAAKLWKAFLFLGFHDRNIMEDVLRHADDLLVVHGRRWGGLYSFIIKHALVRGQHQEAIMWHERLIRNHPPDHKEFAELCKSVVYRKGCLKTLRDIYMRLDYRHMYGHIVPTLCDQEDYESAIDWHLWLIRQGDTPSSSRYSRLLKYTQLLVTYQTLREVGSFSRKSQRSRNAEFPTQNGQVGNPLISREMMNIIHGKTFHIPVKSYNDELGARWFATTWVSLDGAIKSVHALGIQEIGPLSLQSICLREPQAEMILGRIKQLANLGISVGNSAFARAVEYFAQNGHEDQLFALLHSDQHPDTLEDWKLQEALLASYLGTQDWQQYQRTLAILMFATRPLGTKNLNSEAQNIWVRALLTTGDVPAAIDALSNMSLNGTVVNKKTLSYVMQIIMRPRKRGHKPNGEGDVTTVTTILKDVMEAGHEVDVSFWEEIIRRLGMLGHIRDLHDLCIYLASWYGSETNRFAPLRTLPPRRLSHFPTMIRISPSTARPLDALFPAMLQKALVQWGFIHALNHMAKPSPKIPDNDPIRSMTSGITLLKKLHQYGVNTDTIAIRKAIFDRLVTYYGPGESNKIRNETARNFVPELGAMLKQIDEAMGGPTFGATDLKMLIDLRGRSRMVDKEAKETKRA
jgi:hypothetical protein